MYKYDIEGEDVRGFPSVDALNTKQKNDLQLQLINYLDFLDKVRIPLQVTEKVVEEAEKQGFKSLEDTTEKDNKFYIISKDKGCFALLKYSSKPIKEGIKALATHTDSPCLMAKRPRPLVIEWDKDLKELHKGVELDVCSYGGIQPYRWDNLYVDIIGWFIKNGKRIPIKLEGHIDTASAHTDTRDMSEIETIEELNVDLGYSRKSEILRKFGMENEDDFAASKVYVTPKNDTQAMQNYVVGYGHDDRSCVFCGLEAFLESKTNDNIIFFGFDREEIGSTAKGGAAGKFFENVVYELIKRKEGIKEENITEAYLQSIFKNSIIIGADTCVGANRRNVHDFDKYNVAKMGFGTCLSTGPENTDYSNETSPEIIDSLRKIFKKRKVCYQVVGSPVQADYLSGATHAVFFSQRGIDTIDLGIAVSGLHGPIESLATADLFWTKQAYKVFLEEAIEK